MELLIEATVGLAGAASSLALYRGVKRRLYPSQEEKDLYAVDASMAGRTVLVTGANSGVGLAAAELLARKVSEWVGGRDGKETREGKCSGSVRAGPRKKGTPKHAAHINLHLLTRSLSFPSQPGRPRLVCMSGYG